MASLLQVIIASLRQSMPGMDPNAALMQQAMRVLAGDWLPFNDIREPVRDHLVIDMLQRDTSASALAALSQRLASEVREFLIADTRANIIIGDTCNADSDPIGITVASLTTHLHRTIDLWIHFHPTPSAAAFSDQLKALEIEFVGSWLETLHPCLNEGARGLDPFLRQFNGIATQEITSRYPEHAMMAMFGLPLLTNLIFQFHDEYRRGRGLPVLHVPVASHSHHGNAHHRAY